MSEENNLEQYGAVFQLIAAAVQKLPDEQRSRISAQLGEYTHDFKHLLGLVTGANSVLLRSAPSDETGDLIVEMAGISDKAVIELNQLIELIIEQLNLAIQPQED